MKKHLSDCRVYLRGSKKTIRRTVYRSVEDGRYYIVWYGNYIEVEAAYVNVQHGWVTREEY